MVSKKTVAFLLLIFSARSQAYQQPVEVFEYINDVKIVAFIDKQDINDALPWRPFQAPPPLTIAGALTAVRRHISSRQKELVGATLSEIKLRQIPHYRGHWHYLLKLKTPRTHTPVHYFVVLMNGKVIPAVQEVESYK